MTEFVLFALSYVIIGGFVKFAVEEFFEPDQPVEHSFNTLVGVFWPVSIFMLAVITFGEFWRWVWTTMKG